MDPSAEIKQLKERIDRVPDWIWEVDLDGVVTYSNHVVRDVLGYTAHGAVGMSIFDLIVEDDAAKCRELFRRSIEGGQPIKNVITRFQAKDGRIRTIEISCVPVLEDKGKMTGFRGISRDISEYFNSQQLAEQVVRNSQTGVFIIQKGGAVVFANPRICEVMGYAVEEVLGTPIWRYVHPDDSAWLSDYQTRRLAGEQVPTQYVARGITKGGEVRHYDLRAAVIEYEGAPAILLNAVDITDAVLAREALAKSENEFRELVEKTSDWVWQVDESIVYTYASPRAREMFGYEPEEIVGKTPFDLMLPDEAKRVSKAVKPAIDQRQPIIMLENAMLHRDGHIVLVETNAEPIFDEDRRFLGYRGIDRDITERKKVEERLRESEARYKTLFVANPHPMWVFDLQTLAFLAVNDSAIAHYGYSRNEFLSMTIKDIRPPEDIDRLLASVAATKDGTDESGLWRHIKKDGTAIDVETTSHAISWGGRPADVVLVHDITDRKRAEDQLHRAVSEMETVLHAFPDVYFWLDADGTILDYHAADPSELYLPPEQFLGKKMAEVLPGDVGTLFAEAAAKVVRTGSMVCLEYPLEVAHGVRHYEARLMPLPDNQAIAIVRNITERVAADEALGESREMLRLVLTNIPQFIFWKDTNSVYLGCNENFARVAGLASSEAVVGKTDYDLPWRKEEADSFRDWDRRVMESDQPAFHIIESQLMADGKTAWVDTNKVPLHDAEGNVVGILGTYEDITQRRQSEQALQEAEAKYRSLVEETMVGVYMVQDDRFVYANPRMLEIFGTTTEEMVGQSPLEFVAPEDRALVAENLRKRFSGDVKSTRYGFKALRKDGTPIDVEVHGALTSFMGRPAVIDSLIDITERKRYVEALQDSEERYRQLFEHSPDMVLLVSAATNTFIAMNPAVTLVLGYAPYDVLGKSPWDISPEFQPNGRPSKDEAIRLLVSQSGAPAHRFEWVHKHKNGTLIDCEISLVSYRFHGEDLIQAIIRDVTERKRVEESQRRLEKELDRQKRVFYRETILSVTNGKLDICDYSDVESYIARATSSVEVENASQVGPARHKAESLIHEHGLTGERLDSFMVGVGEAITNAIKHGVHGTVAIGEDATSVWVVVSDKGTGIESLILPRAVLLRGFSTKPSLGLGYSIILDVSDRILLSTGEQGTSVVLIKDKAEHDLMLSPEFLPDTWDNIPS
jgi:PAS domain S-box-containing protein